MHNSHETMKFQQHVPFGGKRFSVSSLEVAAIAKTKTNLDPKMSTKKRPKIEQVQLSSWYPDNADFLIMAGADNESYIIEQYASQVLDFSTQVKLEFFTL